MNFLSASTPLKLGFLTVLEEPSSYLGGYLVTNAWGRPLEFRLSTAVQPSRSNIAFDDIVVRTVVRRCTLVDVKPTYHVGLQFLELMAPEILDLVKLGEQLKARAAGQDLGATGPAEPSP